MEAFFPEHCPAILVAMSLGKDHRVELTPYTGPMDLLLWLIRQEEVDIHDIPISQILTRYLEMLQAIQLLDLEQAGDFLVMASRLMEIKSRSLLPREETLEDEEFDPRFELVQKLLEYRKFKELSERLRMRADEWVQRFPRGRAPRPASALPDEVPLADVSLWDLALSFQRLMSEVGDRTSRAIIYDDLPIEVHMEGILGRLEKQASLPFRELFPVDADRTRITGIFLALLELIRQRRVSAHQEEPFGPIEIAVAVEA